MCWGSLRPGQFREVTLPRGWAPAPASIVSRPLASGAEAADGDRRKRRLLSPGRTHVGCSLRPAFLRGTAHPASSWGKPCLGRKRGGLPSHIPQQGCTCAQLALPPVAWLGMKPAWGPRCPVRHWAGIGVGPGPTAFKLRVVPRVDVYPLIPHSHWEICR